jgi:transketolase N-terminal domain/subunit
MVELKKRLVEIAYKHKLGHLGSYFSALEIIDSIYNKDVSKFKDDKSQTNDSSYELESIISEQL